MILRRFFTLFLGLMALNACESKQVREPAAVKVNYDKAHVDLLKSAAKNGVLFQLSTKVFQDTEIHSADDKCKKSLNPVWDHKLFELLKLFKSNPEYYKKIHVIDIRRGDIESAQIDKDLDGAQILKIQYAKKEIRKKIELLTDVPCDGDANFWLDKELTITKFNWPEAHQIREVLDKTAEKQFVARFNFKTHFLTYLADRATILNLEPSLGFEKLLNGDSFLSAFLNGKSTEIETRSEYKYLDYWFNEISKRSAQATQLKLLQIKQDPELKSGVHVETEGNFSRKLKNLKNVTSLVLSYKITGEHFLVNTLTDLELCLKDLHSEYSNIFSFEKKFDLSSENFMYPGYQCSSINER